MPHSLGAASYVAVLRIPGAPRAFTAAALARLSYGTVVLSLLLTVQASTGSFAAAGAALGAFGVPAIVSPLKSRAIDRYGRSPILVPLGATYAVTLLAIAACAERSVHSSIAYVALAGIAGLLTPPVGPVMRGIWACLTPEPAARQRAYSLDSVFEETLFAVGPLLVGAVIAIGTPQAALVMTAGLALLGSLGLATASVRAPAGAPRISSVPGRSHRVLGPLALPEFRWVVLVMFVVGVGLSPLDLAVVARAAETGSAASAGYALAALSVGSAAGGLIWGRRQHLHPYRRQLLTLLAALAVGTAAAGLAPTLPALAAALALTGLAVAPIFVVAYLAADRITAQDSRTEATTWVATASNLGGALGAAGSGYLVDQTSAQTALLLAAGTMALATAALGALRSRTPASGAVLTPR